MRSSLAVVAAVAAVALLAVCVEAVSPTANLWEDVQFVKKQEDVAPVGRPDFQAQALARFAAGLAADPYGVLPLWTGESHPCGDASNNNRPWPGVTCDAPTGFVTGIQLRGKALKGNLPDSLSVLKTLRLLDLSNNSFQGPLPSWSNLTSLETCDLSSNSITGSLLAMWSSWSAIESLSLSHNKLTGPLPGSWAGMNILQVLDLSHNQLTGTLPPAWAQLGYLSVLNLASNNLEGTLPPAWSQQRSLLQLNIGSNRFEGMLPSQWAKGMDSLRGVNATGNALQGSLPTEWVNMTSLQVLSVDKNQLTGSIPSTWTKLHNLYLVNVSSNEGLCGFVPAGVSAVAGHNTTNLNTRCPWIDDANHLLAFKAALLDATPLSNWRPSSNPCGLQPWAGLVCDGGWVVSVRLQNRGLVGPLTPDLVQMSHLQELHLSDNVLTGTLPTEWAAAPSSLSVIDLSNNTLEGTLPKSWAAMSALVHLDLSHNHLLGELPEDWGSGLKNLTTLILSSNEGLNGTLPAAWSGLSSLVTVRLDDGNFTGKLPASWGKLLSLQEMSISSNALTGTVPAPLAELNYLDLSHNQLLCGSKPISSPNSTLNAQRTSLGQDCSTLFSNAVRLSGIRGVLLGACLGVIGTLIIAGTVFLVMRACSARQLRSSPQPTKDRSVRVSRTGSARTSPAPSPRSGTSPLKVLQPSSPSCSPVPPMLLPTRDGPASPAQHALLAQGPLGGPPATATRPSSPLTVLSLPTHLLANGLLGSAGSSPTARPMSPFSAEQPQAAAADDAAVRQSGLQHSSSVGSLQQLAARDPMMPHSPTSELALARSLSLLDKSAVTAAAGTGTPYESCEPAAALGAPQAKEFDGLPSPQPAIKSPSPAGLKLHVATVLRATAATSPQPSSSDAAGRLVRLHVEAMGHSAGGVESPTASPRAAAGVEVPEDS